MALEASSTHLGPGLQVEEAVEGGTGPQVPQQEVMPVLVNGPFQGLQVPGLKEVLGKDVPEEGQREGTRQLHHPPRPDGLIDILVLAFFAPTRNCRWLN